MTTARDAKPIAKRPIWKQKRWWVVALALAGVWLVGTSTIPHLPFGPYTLYGGLTPEQKAAKIPYEILSDEKIDPFLVVGIKVNSPPVIEASMKRWSNVRSCLIEAEKNNTTPDLRFIDWNQFSKNEEADVCLWRIFSSLKSADRVDKWIAFHRVNGKIDVDDGNIAFPTRGIERLRMQWHVYRHSINYRFENGKLYEAQMTYLYR